MKTIIEKLEFVLNELKKPIPMVKNSGLVRPEAAIRQRLEKEILSHEVRKFAAWVLYEEEA